MELLGIDTEQVFKCFNDSFERENDFQSGNRLLENDTREFKENHNGITMHPQIVINQVALRGDEDVFDAVCMAFKHKPSVCQSNTILNDDDDEDLNFSSSDNHHNQHYSRVQAIEISSKLKKLIIIGTVVIGIVCELSFWLWYKRKNQR